MQGMLPKDKTKRIITFYASHAMRKEFTFDRFVRTIFAIAIVVGILVLTNRLSGVLLPFFIAWLAAYLIYPLVKFFQYKLKLKSRILSIFCSLIVVAGIIAGAIFLLVPPMVEELAKLKQLLTTYFINGTHSAAIPEYVMDFIQQNIDINWISNALSEENIMKVIRTALPKVWNMLAQSVNIVFSILASFIILLYLIFILLDYESIADGWIRLVPQKYRPFVANLAADVQSGMNKYFRGQAFVALCVGILFSIGFLIIDFPLAIGLGLFIGALNMIPYLQIIGFAPTILLALLKAADTGDNFWLIMLSALAVFCIVQIIEDTIIVPRVMGKITGLNPAIILLSLSIWGSLMGILGMIIALPLTTLMLSYYQRYIIKNEKEHEPIPSSADYQKDGDQQQ